MSKIEYMLATKTLHLRETTKLNIAINSQNKRKTRKDSLQKRILLKINQSAYKTESIIQKRATYYHSTRVQPHPTPPF